MKVTFIKDVQDPRPNRKGVFRKGRTYSITGSLLDTFKKKKVIKEFEEVKIKHGSDIRNESKDS